MAKFTANIDEQRYYPTLGLTINPGDVIELPAETVAYGLTIVDTPKPSKKSAETPASEDAPATEGVTN
jgi:hypothetical protein